jgi:hypothetical protein
MPRLPGARRRRIHPVAILMGVAGLAVGFLAVSALREATLSTHQRVDPDSQTELVLTADARGAERTQSLAELVDAQVRMCRMEVNSDLVGEITPQGDNEFRAVLQPAMDETNRRQFRGCVEDWLLDHVRVNVTELRDLE